MIKKIFLGSIALVCLLLVGIVVISVYNVIMDSKILEVSIVNNAGQKIGEARMTETDAGVLMHLKVAGLKPNGEHAFHIHEVADCWPQKTFKNAGGHYNPKEKSHGMMHPEGYHAGDMPNLKPSEDGRIEVQMLNQEVTLSKSQSRDGRAPLFDEDGSAIIIHAGADDHKSQPSGAAGNRIACGEIRL